jgi:hypothetical protein
MRGGDEAEGEGNEGHSALGARGEKGNKKEETISSMYAGYMLYVGAEECMGCTVPSRRL